MSTYNENLQTTVINTLTHIDAEEQRRDSENKIAHHNLYHNIGVTLRAKKTLQDVNTVYGQTRTIDIQSVHCSNRANNLLAAATNAHENVATTVTNTTTAATNVRVATHAVLKVAGNIGSANNIVNASDYDTDIQHLTCYANDVIGKTAYHAELVSQLSMQASADAAQITAKDVLAKAKKTKALFDEMRVRTATELQSLTDKRIADTHALVKASTEQRGKEGLVNVAIEELRSVLRSQNTANRALNYHLQVGPPMQVAIDPETLVEKKMCQIGPEQLTTIHVSFEYFVSPFKLQTNSNPQNSSMTQDADNTESKETNKYYIAVAKAGKAKLFHSSIAELTFHNYPPHHPEARFTEVKPGREGQNVVLRENDLDKKDKNKSKKKLLHDIDGDLIEAGKDYVLFLYIELAQSYKRATNNFSDILSAPAEPFSLAQTLPYAQSLHIPSSSSKNLSTETLHYHFEVEPVILHENGQSSNVPTEYRCMLVPKVLLEHLGKNPQVDLDPEQPEQSQDCETIRSWFTLDVATKVAPVNYVLARPSEHSEEKNQYEFFVRYPPQDSSKETPKEEDNQLVTLETDNFGHHPDHSTDYVLMVLSIVPPTATHNGFNISSHYSPRLTCFPSKPEGAKVVAKEAETKTTAAKDAVPKTAKEATSTATIAKKEASRTKEAKTETREAKVAEKAAATKALSKAEVEAVAKEAVAKETEVAVEEAATGTKAEQRKKQRKKR